VTRTAVVLQHDPSIHLGNLGPLLVEHGYTVHVVDVTTEDVDAIDPAGADLVVVLGGDIAAYQTDEYPFLEAEKRFLRARLGLEGPTLGVCLGAQLMANALGGRVYRGASTQIGYRTVEATPAGADSPIRHFEGVPVVQWHGDTFDLPPLATRLASSSAYANEAFAIGRHALGVQFHPEATAAMHERWVEDGANELDEHAVDTDALRRDRERHSARLQQASHAAFSEWLGALRR
jgi:GMP synthase (glutamine-hydrolysing)